MELNKLFNGMNLSASGMQAERQRLDVISKNIANANVVSSTEGGAYRRQEVVFETILNAASDELEGGVRVAKTLTDYDTPLNELYDPGHPMADKETGMVQHSNVNMAFEMVDMMVASRAYEANLKAVGVYRDMMRQAMTLLEG